MTEIPIGTEVPPYLTLICAFPGCTKTGVTRWDESIPVTATTIRSLCDEHDTSGDKVYVEQYLDRDGNEIQPPAWWATP